MQAVRRALRRPAFVLVAWLACGAAWGAETPSTAADIPPGAQPCLGCHGAHLAVGAPAIAGQTSNFIQWQLVFFRTGRRHNQIMQALAGGLSDVDIRKIGAYFASLPAPQPPAPKDDAPALTEAGATLSAQRHCTSCHGEKLEGQAAAPRLARQPEAYLAKSLIDYRSGARPSSGGAAMTEVAGGLSDDDIKDVAHYLAVLPE